MWDFVLRVSLRLLEVRVGGCRHRCRVDEERVSEQRWDFSPSLFFSLSIYSSRAAECHLLNHNWSRNERCGCKCVCLCVSEYITSACINSPAFFWNESTVCELGNNYYCIAIIIFDVWFMVLLDQLLLTAGPSRLAEHLLSQQSLGATHAGQSAYQLKERHNYLTHSGLGAIQWLKSIWTTWRTLWIVEHA